MGFLKAERRLAGLGRLELEGPTRSVADPQRANVMTKEDLLKGDRGDDLPGRKQQGNGCREYPLTFPLWSQRRQTQVYASEIKKWDAVIRGR
jgi:hypothetical protein